MIDKTDLNTLIANKYYNRTATHSVNDNWSEALRVAEEIKQLFIEQTCDAIKKEIRDEMDSIDDEIGYSTSHKEGYEYAMERAQQVIKDKFK